MTHEDTTFDLTKFERRAFCFWGKTGSGKSAVLDGIHYALWGTPLNSKRRGKKDCLRSDTAPEKEDMSATLMFTVDGQSFEVVRRMTPAGSGFVKLTLPDGEVVEKSKDVQPILEERFGLTEGQFDTISMLEQGGFAKFLQSSSTERESILRDLFSTHHIEEFTNFAVSHAKELLQQLELQASTLTQLTGVQSIELDNWLIQAKATLVQKDAELIAQEASAAAYQTAIDECNTKLGELGSKKKTLEELNTAQFNLDEFLRTHPIHECAEDDQLIQLTKELIERYENALKYAEVAHSLTNNRSLLTKYQEQLQSYQQHVNFPELVNIETLRTQLCTQSDVYKATELERQRLLRLIAESTARDSVRLELTKLVEQKTTLETDLERTKKEYEDFTNQLVKCREDQSKHTQLSNQLESLKKELSLFNDPIATQNRLNELYDHIESDFIAFLDNHIPDDSGEKKNYFLQTDRPRFNLWQHPSLLAGKNIQGQDVDKYNTLCKDSSDIETQMKQYDDSIAKIADLSKTVSTLQIQLGKLQGFLNSANTKIGANNALINKFETENPDETTEGLKIKAETAEKLYQEQSVQLNQTAELIHTLEQLQNGINQINPLVTQTQRIVNEQNKLLGGIEGDNEFNTWGVEKLQSELDVKRQELSRLEAKVKAVESEEQTLKATVETLKKVAPKTDPTTEIESITDKREKISESLTETSTMISTLTSEITALKHVVNRCETAIPEFAELRDKQRTWKYTADLISGNNPKKVSLESFVLNSRLAQIVDAANLYLQKFYPDRFELQASLENATKRSRAGLALIVYDLAKGTERFPETFSGGETFILSLALALGLSQTTQDVVANPLQDLFIDEGFGTLDAETLSYVATALQDLTTTGVSVGIITHVEALQQAVGHGFKLTKNNESKTEVSYL